jgi:hypothetical protein
VAWIGLPPRLPAAFSDNFGIGEFCGCEGAGSLFKTGELIAEATGTEIEKGTGSPELFTALSRFAVPVGRSEWVETGGVEEAKA